MTAAEDFDDDIRDLEARVTKVRSGPTPLRWRWRLGEDVFFGPPKPPRWIARELGLAPGRPAILSGASGGSKTLLLQSLLISLAVCRPIWNRFDPDEDAKPLTVAHVDVDLGQDDLEHRYRRLYAGFPGAPILREEIAPRFRMVSFPIPELDLMQASARDRLKRELEGVDVAGIDALRGVSKGDENSSEFRRGLDLLTAVSGETGTMFIVLHHISHAPRAQQGGRPVSDDDDDRAGRGTTAIKDAAGVVLRVTGKGDTRKIRMVKPPGRTGIQWTKPFSVSIEDVDDVSIEGAAGLRVVAQIPHERSKEEIADLAAESAVLRRNQIIDIIFRIVRSGGAFRGGVDALVGTTRDAMKGQRLGGLRNVDGRALINSMIEDAKLFAWGKGKAARISITPPPQTEITT